MTSNLGIPTGDKTADIIKTFQEEGLKTAIEVTSETLESREAFMAEGDFKDIAEATAKTIKLGPPERAKTEKAERAQESILIRKEEADGLADGFNRREGNRQYHLSREGLSQIARGIGVDITAESNFRDLIAKIRDNLMVGTQEPDVAQVDKALDFLLEVLKSKIDSAKNDEIKKAFQKIFDNISAVKEQYHKENQKDIETAQKIIDIADLVAQEGKKEASQAIKDLRDIVNNPQDLSTKFSYYKNKGYSFKDMKHEIDLIFKYVGFKFKDAELLPAEMSRLIDETRTLQAILQIFRHFKRGMPLIHSLLSRKSIPIFPNLNFEFLGSIFMKMVDERYPSPDKITLFSQSLADRSVSSEYLRVMMRIIFLNSIRDAIREVSPFKVFRSIQHRHDLYYAIIAALEDLEDALEEQEENKHKQEEGEEEEEQGKKKGRGK